jgi:hypothetical protein
VLVFRHHFAIGNVIEFQRPLLRLERHTRVVIRWHASRESSLLRVENGIIFQPLKARGGAVIVALLGGMHEHVRAVEHAVAAAAMATAGPTSLAAADGSSSSSGCGAGGGGDLSGGGGDGGASLQIIGALHLLLLVGGSIYLFVCVEDTLLP